MVLFIGPTLLSGIGQTLNKYVNLMGGQYIELGQPFESNQNVMMWALPVPMWLDNIPHIKKKSRRVVCMTVCETETVHPEYEKLFRLFDHIVTPSIFCQQVFMKQFPWISCSVIAVHVPIVKPPKALLFNLPKDKYIFYHIGNVMDPRKNTKKIIEAFIRLNLPDSLLVLKATCREPVYWSLPNVHVINGLLPDTAIRGLHNECHCYVSFSSSEGVGMGAVEAALYNKPVITTDFGAQPEYINTRYLIRCGRQELPADDFLFQKGMVWGKPSFEDLLTYMKHAYENKVYYEEHEYTRKKVDPDTIRRDILNQFSQGDKPVSENALVF